MAEQLSKMGMDSRPWRHSLRLTFQYEGERVSLVSSQRVQMIATPSVTAQPEKGRSSGYWFEVQDQNGRVLFYRLLHNPLGTSVEVFHPDGSIRRVTGPPTEGEFEVIVPDIPDASTIVLFGSVQSLAAKGESKPAGELGRFSLRPAPLEGR